MGPSSCDTFCESQIAVNDESCPFLAGETAIHLNGEFTWDLNSPATLVDIDVVVPTGGFLAVVGPTGKQSPESCAAALPDPRRLRSCVFHRSAGSIIQSVNSAAYGLGKSLEASFGFIALAACRRCWRYSRLCAAGRRRVTPTTPCVCLSRSPGVLWVFAGGGKSSLLAAALGLMQQVAGDPVAVRGRVAYVPQVHAQFCTMLLFTGSTDSQDKSPYLLILI